MPKKYAVIFLPFFAAALLAASPALAGKIPWNVTDNHFLLDMPYGDQGTVYLISDNTLILHPSYTNRNYTHVCHGRWNFDEDRQILKIDRAKNCTFMNGTYRVTRNRDALLLRNPQRELVFRMF